MAEQSGGAITRKSRAFADKLNKLVVYHFVYAKLFHICEYLYYTSCFRTHSAAQAREMAASTITFSHQRSDSFGSQSSITSKSSQDTIQGIFSGTVSTVHQSIIL